MDQPATTGESETRGATVASCLAGLLAATDDDGDLPIQSDGCRLFPRLPGMGEPDANCRTAAYVSTAAMYPRGRQRLDEGVLRCGQGRLLPSLAVELDIRPELLEKATQLGHGVGM